LESGRACGQSKILQELPLGIEGQALNLGSKEIGHDDGVYVIIEKPVV